MAGDSSKATHQGSHYSNRRRVVSRQWLRDPSGSILPRPPPVGTRAPNGLIWGHSLEDFMWIQRVPNVNVLTIWTRSMIKEFAENYDESEFDAPEPLPRVRHPWPVLRIAQDARNRTIPPIGAYDEGSDHEDDEPRTVRSWCVRADDPKTGESCQDKIINRFVIENLSDALVPNDGENPVMSPLRHPYAALWTPDYRKGYAVAKKIGTCNHYTLIRRPGGKGGHAELADETGLMTVTIHDTDEGCEPPTRHDPAALVIDDGGKTLTVFHDPTPVVFLNKVMKGTGRNTEEKMVVPEETPDKEAKEDQKITDDVEMATPTAIEDKDTHDETKAETMEICQDAQSEIDAEPKPSTSVENSEGTQEPHSSDDVASTPMMTDKGTRLVMIGVLDEESDSEDEHESEDEETDKGEVQSEVLTKHIKADSTFDEEVLKGLPKLEEFIPEEYFPDALMVHRQGQVRHSSSLYTLR